MRFFIIFILLISVLTSCINEDLSKCTPKAIDVEIFYTVEIDGHYDNGFTVEPILTSLHTGFWTAEKGLYEESNIPQADFPADMQFRFSLPRDNYDHIVTANASADAGYTETLYSAPIGTIALSGRTVSADTISALRRPAFVGRLYIPGDTCHCRSHLYVVPMHPVVSRMNLSVKHTQGIRNLRAVIEGPKTGIMLHDTSYISRPTTRVSVGSDFVTSQTDSTTAFSFFTYPVTVNNTASASANGNSALYAPAAPTQWHITFFAEYGDKTVMNRYTINEDLRAGMVYNNIFKFFTDLDTDNTEVGVEVNLDWKPGSHHDEEI